MPLDWGELGSNSDYDDKEDTHDQQLSGMPCIVMDHQHTH